MKRIEAKTFVLGLLAFELKEAQESLGVAKKKRKAIERVSLRKVLNFWGLRHCFQLLLWLVSLEIKKQEKEIEVLEKASMNLREEDDPDLAIDLLGELLIPSGYILVLPDIKLDLYRELIRDLRELIRDLRA
jgi:hypothetical protein